MYRAIARNKLNTVIIITLYMLGCAALGAYGAYLTKNLWVGVGFLAFIAMYTVVQYFKAAEIAILLAGGVEVTSAEENPRLWRTVENLSISQGLPMPKVYVIQDDSMNAFAAGRDPKHAVVAATSSLLSQLEKFELEGVMAHEMAHVKNLDIRVKTVIFGLVGAMAALARFCFYFAFGVLSGSRSYRTKNSENAAAIGIALAVLALAVGAVLSIFAFVVGPIAVAAVSRQREYLADASGAMMTRHPEGLISALIKLERGFKPIAKSSRGTSHLYFTNPLRRFFWSSLTSSHPPTGKRVERLYQVGTSF